jgi:peptide methionine sulfoxide reductase MsrA
VTEVRELEHFYLADSGHQQYYMKNPTGGYCREVLGPKVREFKSRFQGQLYQFI